MTEPQPGDIAIVAMECRIPGADNPDDMWDLLLRGDCTIRDLSDDELEQAGATQQMRSRPTFVRRAGVLDDIDKFDAGYFEMSAREADVLDVQQRLMLEAAVTLLNRGNVDPARAGRRIGVFAGSGFSSYLFGVLQRDDLMDSLGEMLVRHGNDKDFLATRISYKLNLDGPSLNVQTSCSTGLVAVHSAVQSLLLGECDLAIAGAVCIKVPQYAGYMHQPDGVLSPDGMCRPFDAQAQGTIFTNGLGLVLIKRLEDAVADGDDVVAIIAGSAVNNDGARKVGFTAPSVGGQSDALASALLVAGVHPSQVQYIEAHGTGTLLGDPIEVEAIKQAYGIAGPRCGIGSLKGNFGHFNIASGIIGLIKAALVVRHGIVPPTLHVRQVNPELRLDGTRFFVTEGRTELDTRATRYAAVSAFGMGGTNSHVVLRSHDATAQTAPSVHESAEDWQIFAFSTRNLPALERLAARHARHLHSRPELCLADVAWTAHIGRPVMAARGALVARNSAEAAARLESGEWHRGMSLKLPPIAFVFGGQGTQCVEMGHDLARRHPAFARRLEEALTALGRATGQDLAACLWQPGRADDLAATDVAQPLIFAVEYALADVLIEAGVRPAYLMGHSLGEVVAATVSGVFGLEVAAAIIARRSRLMAACAPGAMLSVETADPFEPMFRAGDLTLAARNGPRQLVLAGSIPSIDAAQQLAEQQGLVHHRLRTFHAFHSPMMQAAAEAFGAYMATVPLGQARIPLASNITGQLLGEYEYRNPLYWADHLVKTVRFGPCVETLLQLGVRHFIEVGHGFAMGNLVRANVPAGMEGKVTVVHALGAVDTEYASFLDTIAVTSTLAPGMDLAPFIPEARKVGLPVYPFARDSHWVRPVSGFQSQPSPSTQALPVCATVLSAAGNAPTRVGEEPGQWSAPVASPGTASATAPANPVEAIVEEVYRDFLGGENIDPQATFFDLGGNSTQSSSATWRSDPR